jgi:hypothetical protein
MGHDLIFVSTKPAAAQTYEHDISALRRIVDTIDHGMNPDRKRVPPRTPEEAKAKEKSKQ